MAAASIVSATKSSASSAGSLSPSATSAAVPIETASAPSASAFATSAPLRTPPEMINCTLRCIPSSSSARTAGRIAASVGIPTLAAIRPAVRALEELGMHRKVQLIISGGVRCGADVAKALALGADAVSIGTAALIALGDNDPALEDEYRKLGTTAGAYDDWQDGLDPAGITTQDPDLVARLDPVKAGRRLANYLSVLTLEAQTIARACGKSHVHNLEPEDLVALTIEAAAMARVPLAGT